jgi:hypothetical protein
MEIANDRLLLPDPVELKNLLASEVDSYRASIIEVSETIHVNRGLVVDVHTPQFAQAAVPKTAHEALTGITRVMAMRAIELLNNTGVLEAAKMEFSKYPASGFTYVSFAMRY